MMDEELAAAVHFHELRGHQEFLKSTTIAKRWKLLEAQKQMAWLEVISMNRKKMREIEERAQAALKAAQEANARITKEKRLQRQSLAATSRAWRVTPNKGQKRPAEHTLTGPRDVVDATPSKMTKRAAP